MAHNPNDETIFSAIGRAITEWAFYEGQLCNVFSVCTSASDGSYSGIHLYDPGPSVAAFYAVENFRSKLGMVDAAVRARFKPFSDTEAILAQWSKLHDKARKLSLKRNRLAHWNVIGGDTNRRLIPPHRSPAADDYFLGPKRGLTLHDLQQLQKAFCLLGAGTGEIAKLMIAHPELQSRYAKLVARQLDSARRRQDRIVVERLELALSSPE